MQVLENMADPERFERPTLRFVVWQQASKINTFWRDFRREVARKSAVLLAVGTILTSPALAGGPVLIEEAFEAEPAPKLTAGEKLAIAAGLLLVIALASGGSSDVCNGDDQPTPEPGPC